MNIAFIIGALITLLLCSIKGCDAGSDTTSADVQNKVHLYNENMRPQNFHIRAMVYNSYLYDWTFRPVFCFLPSWDMPDAEYRKDAVSDGLNMIKVSPWVVGHDQPGHNNSNLHTNLTTDGFVNTYKLMDMTVSPQIGALNFNESSQFIPLSVPVKMYKIQCYVFMAEWSVYSTYQPGDDLGTSSPYDPTSMNYQPAAFLFLKKIVDASIYHGLSSEEEINYWIVATLMHELSHINGNSHQYADKYFELDKDNCSDSWQNEHYVDAGACMFCRHTHDMVKQYYWVSANLYGAYEIGQPNSGGLYTRKWWCQFHADEISSVILKITKDKGV